MTNNLTYRDVSLFCLLVICGVVLRLWLRDYPNVSPVCRLGFIERLFIQQAVNGYRCAPCRLW